ncbi:uncharacterized protein LOC100137715 isoform X2 [Xenopus laevis]|uniref:Uncharacterized protein LOC100137715 isoform X2 n=2 Tax=Xenopus laevis TaxID=8355 RepID=A0A8J1L0Y4_XENLA|nr:uncharacterized protein LOC100137715 isoform X2 [Xenopus laevis]
MLVGATGSGKTTLINALINYILGVKWEDNYRLILIEEDTNRSQAHSQTSEVTAYQLNHIEAFTVPYNLTIIDTPGFDDTRGRDHDKEIPRQLKLCFDSPGSISHIDAIYFVLPSGLPRLTSTQEYIFGSMLSIFAKDIENNIQICATFADAGKPMVLKALTESNVACVKNRHGIPVYFKFNNCALYAKKSEEEDDDDDDNENSFLKLPWDTGKTSSEKLFRDLARMESKSLVLTKEVLEEREALEGILDGLGRKTEEIALYHQELSKLNLNMKENEQIIKENSSYEYEMKENVKTKIPVQGEVHNCNSCETTCSRYGNLFQRIWKWLKWVFSMECSVCGHNERNHVRESHEWRIDVKTTKLTHKELKEKYEKAYKKKLSIDEMIQINENKKKDQKDEAMRLIERAAEVLRRLQEIALKPNSLTVTDYIDLLINKERQEGKLGFQERIASLEEFKDKTQ